MTTMNRRSVRTSIVGLALSCLCLAPAPLPAANFVWDGEISPLWDTAILGVTNWEPDTGVVNPIPDGNDQVFFSGPALVTTVSLNGNRTVLSANFAGAVGYTLTDDTLTTNVINTNNSAQHVILSDIGLTANALFDIDNSSELVLQGVINGAFTLTKTGTGTLTLDANHQHAGTVVAGGTLVIDQINRIGTGGTGLTLADGTTLTTTAGITLGSGRSLTLGSGQATLDQGANNLTLTGPVSGAGGFIKTGSGDLTFNATTANTYTGLATIADGNLLLDNSGGQSAITGDLTLDGGNAQMLANNQIADTSAVTVTNGTFTQSTFNETIDSLTVGTGGTWSSTASLLTVSSALTIDGGQFLKDATPLPGNAIDLTLGAGAALTVQNGGLFEWTESILRLDAPGSSVLVKGLNSTFRNTSAAKNDTFVTIDNGVTVDVNQKGTFEADYLLMRDGAIHVDGAGSTLDLSGGLSNTFDQIISNGSLTLSNNASGNFLSAVPSALSLTGGAGSVVEVTVNSGALLTIQSLTASGGGTVNITVDGLNSFIGQDGASTFSLGSPSGGPATLTISNDGGYITGTGLSTIGATGTVAVTTGGLFDSAGDLVVNGGTLTLDPTSSFSLDNGLTLTAFNNAQIDFAGNYEIGFGTNFDLQSGSDLVVGDYFDMSEGTLTVDGAGTTVNTNTTGSTVNEWGYNAANTVTVRNQATYTINSNAHLFLGDSGPGSATLNIESDADFNANTLTVATTPFGTAAINLTGTGSTLTQSGAATLTIGSPDPLATGTAAINVTDNATFTTGTGVIDLEATGTIDIGTGGTGGTFNANGDMDIDGGSLTRDASGTFELGSGLTLTATNDAQINFNGDYELNDGTTFNLQSGADLVVGNFFDIGSNTGGGSGNGTLIVDGVGTTVTANGNINGHIWGNAGFTADVTFRNGATGAFGLLELGKSNTAGSTGVLNIESAASVTTDHIILAQNDGAISGTINLTGAGSMLTQSGGDLTVGSSNPLATGTAAINVTDNATFNTGTGTGAITVNATGALNVNTGGLFDATPPNASASAAGQPGVTVTTSGEWTIADGEVRLNGGRGGNSSGTINGGVGGVGGVLNMNAGSIDLTGVATVNLTGGRGGDDGLFGIANAGAGGVGGQANLAGGVLTLSGTSSLNLNGGMAGTFPQNSGNPRGGRGGTMNVSGAAVVVNTGATVLLNGGRGGFSGSSPIHGGNGGHGGDLNLTGGSVDINGGTLSLSGGEGRTPNFGAGGDGGDGGTLTVTSGVLTVNSGLVSTAGGNGAAAGTSGSDGTDGAPGLIDLTGGTFEINGGEVFTGTLNHPGTGAFNFLGGSLSVETFDGDLIQDGGALAPGASPGTTAITGNYVMNAGTLAIELGGLTPGSGHDQVNVTGDATIAGGLDIALTNGFAPNPGDTFELLTFGGNLTGAFSFVMNSTQLAGLILNVTSDADSIDLTLAAALDGDLNLDGFVGIADLNIVLGAWNQNVTAGNWGLGDPSGDGFIGIDDLNAVLGNWNAGTPPQQPGANIPEPGVVLILAAGALGLAGRRQ